MQANWSLILNVLLLTGVIVALVRMLRARKVADAPRATAPSLQPSVIGAADRAPDEVIAVRKIMREPVLAQAQFSPAAPSAGVRPSLSPQKTETHFQSSYGVVAPPPGLVQENTQIPAQESIAAPTPSVEPNTTQPTIKENTQCTLVIFLLAKENRQLAGYELLQTILAAGLRFGEGQLFHRHQYPNGQGPVLCSLATATANGVFDLQNIGAFSVHGLCLFMQTSGNAAIDAERLSVMVDTAKQLSEGLDTYLLDDSRKPWSDESELRYEELLTGGRVAEEIS